MYLCDNNLQRYLAEEMDVILRGVAEKIFWGAILNEAKNLVPIEIRHSRDSSSPLASQNHELANCFNELSVVKDNVEE